MRLPNEVMVNAIVFMIASNQNGLADQRMKRIGDHGFEGQKPGTMAPAPRPAATRGRQSPHCLRPRASTTSTPRVAHPNTRAHHCRLA